MHNLNNKRIILTGAAGGIGQHIAQALAAEGAKLVLTDRNQQALEALQAKLGPQHDIVTMDMSSSEGRQTLYNFCDALDGNIDMLINAAGVNRFALLTDHSEQDIELIIMVNLASQIALCRLMLPLLLKNTAASIVNFGSTLGSIGLPGYSVYSASKFGLRGFSEALNRELMDSSVSVRYFAPRATQTALNTDNVTSLNAELGTAMDPPELVAKAFVDFLKTGSPRHYLGWPEKLFVRINALLPGVVDKSILKQLPIFKRYL